MLKKCHLIKMTSYLSKITDHNQIDYYVIFELQNLKFCYNIILIYKNLEII